MLLNFHNICKKICKSLFHSIIVIILLSVAALFYGRLTLGFFTLRYLFPAYFLGGSVIILMGLIVIFLPFRIIGKLVDHSNYAQVIMAQKEKRRLLGGEFVYLGIAVVVMAAALQVLLSFVV